MPLMTNFELCQVYHYRKKTRKIYGFMVKFKREYCEFLIFIVLKIAEDPGLYLKCYNI